MTPRTYTIPAKLVKAGKAVLAVRVSDFGGEGGIHGKAEELYVEADGKRISLAGDWKYRIGLSLKGFHPHRFLPFKVPVTLRCCSMRWSNHGLLFPLKE